MLSFSIGQHNNFLTDHCDYDDHLFAKRKAKNHQGVIYSNTNIHLVDINNDATFQWYDL